jgi:hypothetical protein
MTVLNGTHVLLPPRGLGRRNNGPKASWMRAARVFVVVVAAGAADGLQSNTATLLHELLCRLRYSSTPVQQRSKDLIGARTSLGQIEYALLAQVTLPLKLDRPW